MKYRRADVKGGTYFFTVNLANRQGSLLIDEIDILRNGMSLVMQRHPFTIVGVRFTHPNLRLRLLTTLVAIGLLMNIRMRRFQV